MKLEKLTIWDVYILILTLKRLTKKPEAPVKEIVLKNSLLEIEHFLDKPQKPY